MSSSRYSHNTSGLSTMGVVHPCRSVVHVTSIDELRSALSTSHAPLIVGGGSNILFTQEQDREIIVIDICGREVIEETQTHVTVRVAAGESWHDLVRWAVGAGYGGIENLSLIPGKCGAAPMQNIGAYGVELSDVLVSVEALDMESGDLITYSTEDCELGYRDSIFKRELREKVVITAITISLTKDGHHQINTSYGAIEHKLSEMKITEPSIADISTAVIAIRQSKLPDPAVLPNNGSFFKNPIISKAQYDELIERYPSMPSYPVSDTHVKVPAGWLIDQCGWKGKRLGQVGTHERQALVIVNHGSTDGQDVIRVAKAIQADVESRYGIALTPEVNIY